MQQDLNGILAFIEQLSEVDTSTVEDMVGIDFPERPLREDVVDDGNDVKKIIANAPSVACEMFVVPKVVE